MLSCLENFVFYDNVFGGVCGVVCSSGCAWVEGNWEFFANLDQCVAYDGSQQTVIGEIGRGMEACNCCCSALRF